jgi:diguanylate cyclase (GGDEF)-like protein
MRILLVDDDELFANLLKTNLTEQRYTVDTATNGQEGWELVEAQNYDLIVLDVMLPKLDGINFCRRLRAKGLQSLVLLLTARGTSDDKVMGLDTGADDYVVKPAGLPELEARIRALLRRKTISASPVLEWGNLRLDPSVGQVTYGGVSLNLSAKEYALLELFMGSAQKIHSQNSIVNQLWSFEDEPASSDTVRTLMKRLRQKLKAVGGADLIETVYGLGYRLNPAFQKISVTNEISSPPQFSKQSSTSINVKNIWEESQSQILEQIAILSQAIQELQQNPLQNNSLQQAQHIAHKLIGSLGILSLVQASKIAQNIEMLLLSQEYLELEQGQFLSNQVQALRLLVERATPQKLEKQVIVATNKNQSEQQIRLLIVDEDREFIDTLLIEATTRGMETAIASNPKLAIEAIARVRPDIILMDMSSSNIREDGLILLEKAFQQTPPIPVLVFASYERTTDRLAIARCQARGFFTKPITPTQILEAIAQTLKHRKTTEAKVMLVDDDRMVLRLARTLLEPWGLQVTTLNNPLQFWDKLQATQPDLLVLDVQMPEIDGIELCQMLRNDARWAWLPILFLTGDRNPDTIQQIFAAGADDYVSKPVVAPELITRIFNRLERTRLLREQAEIEPLTGLPNRHHSTQDLNRLLHLANLYQQPFCFAVLRLDQLNQINRNYGHQTGDQMLRRLAHLLRQELRSEDIISRWEGAEFIVGMYGITRGDGVGWLAEVLEMSRQIELFSPDSQPMHITFSAGVAQYPEDGSDLQTLYQKASEILEKASESGGDRILPANWRSLQSHPLALMDVILLHQDSPFAASIMDALETRGYHAHWLQDGKHAIELLAGNTPSLHGRVILLQENLPNKNGLEVLKHLKRDKIIQRSKILWLSTQLDEVEKALKLGCFDYINIPSKISTFMYRLRQILES